LIQNHTFKIIFQKITEQQPVALIIRERGIKQERLGKWMILKAKPEKLSKKVFQVQLKTNYVK